MARQHASITRERWAQFDFAQQVLMIANELHRGSRLLGDSADDAAARRRCYERVLQLSDLTSAVQTRSGARRELRRWREMLAGLYSADAPDRAMHFDLLRCLLCFTRESARQIPFVAPR